MIEINECQRQALERTPCDIIELVDPRTQRKYVLLPAERYEYLLTTEAENDELDGIDVGRLVNEAMREDDQNDSFLEGYQQYKDAQ